MKFIIGAPTRAPRVRCRFDHKELAIGSPSEGILVGFTFRQLTDRLQQLFEF